MLDMIHIPYSILVFSLDLILVHASSCHSRLLFIRIRLECHTFDRVAGGAKMCSILRNGSANPNENLSAGMIAGSFEVLSIEGNQLPW
jgi:hypothetical protein